jgi:glucokinase
LGNSCYQKSLKIIGLSFTENMSETYIGVDLGGTNLRAGWVTEGKLLHKEAKRVDHAESAEDVIDILFKLISENSHQKAAGIGIGFPSLVDTASGIVYEAQNLPGWNQVPFASIIEDKFGVPVKINNDANCFALGEYHYGKGKPFESMIGLNIGTGFAGGIIIHGELYEGHNCGAGEFGTLPFRDSILEHYCGGLYFEKEHRQSGEKLARKAEKGDIRAMSIFSEFGKYLGFALKSILYYYDPEAIILGGSVSKSFPYYKNSMYAELEEFEFPKTIENLTIEVSEDENIPILGAAALCK